MKQTHTLNRIVVAMMAISHNRVDYPAGAVFEAPEKDIVFLEMAKYVREPTADELKAYGSRRCGHCCWHLWLYTGSPG